MDTNEYTNFDALMQEHKAQMDTWQNLVTSANTNRARFEGISNNVRLIMSFLSMVVVPFLMRLDSKVDGLSSFAKIELSALAKANKDLQESLLPEVAWDAGNDIIASFSENDMQAFKEWLASQNKALSVNIFPDQETTVNAPPQESYTKYIPKHDEATMQSLDALLQAQLDAGMQVLRTPQDTEPMTFEELKQALAAQNEIAAVDVKIGSHQDLNFMQTYEPNPYLSILEKVAFAKTGLDKYITESKRRALLHESNNLSAGQPERQLEIERLVLYQHLAKVGASDSEMRSVVNAAILANTPPSIKPIAPITGHKTGE